MSLEALLIVLMAGTEIFRPLRDLRTVLHQGMTGQAAAAGINALLDAPVTGPGAPSRARPLPDPPPLRGRGGWAALPLPRSGGGWGGGLCHCPPP